MELKHIVSGMTDETSMLEIKYPVDDSKLQIVIPEEIKLPYSYPILTNSINSTEQPVLT